MKLNSFDASASAVCINTIIKTTSVCDDGDARSDGVGRDWLAGWPVTVGVVNQPGADAERYRCACLHCTLGAGWAW